MTLPVTRAVNEARRRYPPPPRSLHDMGRPPLLQTVRRVALFMLVLSLVVAVAGHIYVSQLWRNVLFPEVPAERLVSATATGLAPFAAEMPLGLEVVYGVAYQFEVGGARYQGVGFSDAPIPVAAGDEIQLEFDREDPNVSAPVLYRADPMPRTRLLLIVFLSTLPGLALLLFLWHQRRWHNAIMLIQHGIEATGRVQKVRATARGVFRNVYSFTDPAGREHSCTYPARASISERYGQVGTRVTVFHDPRKPHRFVPYEALVDLPPLAEEEEP